MEGFLPLLRTNITLDGLWSKNLRDFGSFQIANILFRPQELDSLLQDDQSILDSPPRFSFMPEEGDALIENSSPSPPESTFRTEINNDIPEEPEPSFPPTLETRKKKKRSSSIVAPEISPPPTDRQPSPPIDTTQHTTSVSTKRKYVPEDDDRFTSNLDVDDDEFQFTRPSHTPKKQTIPFEDTQRDQSPTQSHVKLTRGSRTPVLSMRRVLEPSMFYFLISTMSVANN